MLRILAQTFMCSIAAFGVFAQTPAETQKSPREIVVEFWSAETNGERLTTDGWYRASRYFVRPNQPHASKIIHVVRNGPADKIEETATADNWTEISVSTNELGMLDEALRFKPSPERGQGGVLLLKGPIITFNLISTSKYWRLKQDGAREKESTGAPEWRILWFEDSSWINVDAAIRFVTEMSKNTNDPVIKQNAGRTLAKLNLLNKN